MQTLDRKKIPDFGTVDKIEIIKATEIKLRNNIPVFTINAGSQELIKIEFIFSAGMSYQDLSLQASSVNTMLEEGTSKMNAAQIADAVDFYGAFLEVSLTQDHASVVLYTLNKHLKATLPVIEQVIKDAVFPASELETQLRNKKQKFLVNSQKVASVARKHFVELLFGDAHPYGKIVKESDFDVICQSHLIEFYKKHYNSGTCKIILAGKVNEEAYTLLDTHFGGKDWSYAEKVVQPAFIMNSAAQPKQLIAKDDALQSAIRIGKVLFNKKHPDFQSMQILNTVFGGYFGSRLMSNIREDKGYTYGIGSGIASLQHSGYFFISTEVGADVCKNALTEIYIEMDRLREELIPKEELQLVKNYLLGTFLRSVDGPFAMADRFKGIMEYDLGYDYFDRYIATIKGISASQLRDLANKYLDKNSMIELVVGKN